MANDLDISQFPCDPSPFIITLPQHAYLFVSYEQACVISILQTAVEQEFSEFFVRVVPKS